ncbi:MAG: hypothetical protein JO332_17710 [Planctomycetaceae bacterium]|nr:hypothetical protein [Planctomycetaceae bacterium]
MSLPPGLLPEAPETKPSRALIVLGALCAVTLLALGLLLVENRKLAHERDDALQRAPLPSTPKPAPPPPADPPVQGPVAAAPSAPIQTSEPAALPPRSVKVRALPEDPEVLTRGLQEFRQGRYDQAERQFFRAIPESFLYLSLTGLAQRNWREAFSFLARAMRSDPQWLRRVNPRDLFGKEGDFDAVLASLDEQLAKNPLDADLKTLAAYLRYHEKGAPYAKALLTEATTVDPDHDAAKAFLEALGP